MNVSLKKRIRTIPHFPKQGIMFRDITTLLKDPQAFRHAVKKMKSHYKGRQIDLVAAAESRGFIFGAVLAHELRAGFVPIRKPGKLPAKTIRQDYELEYGKDAFEMHEDSIEPGKRVLIVDDLLATGGTARAAADLVGRLGGKVEGLAFLIELSYLGGRKKLGGHEVFSLVDYDSE